MRRVYLDHAATTPLRPEVRAAMLPHLAEFPANPSAVHAEGRAARAALDGARVIVAKCLGVKPRAIVFTSGGTEANVTAVLGIARAHRGKGMHLITTVIEHRSVLRAFDVLQDEGFSVTHLPVDAEGRVDPAAFAAAITPQTTFASIMFANNEIGVMQPIAEIAAVARRRGVALHVDAIQVAGKHPLDAAMPEIDALSLSAHKFSGPKGVGILYLRPGVSAAPLLVGGGQENGFRAGTENLASAVGCAVALEFATSELARNADRLLLLRERLEAGVLAMIPEVRINGGGAMRLPHIASMAFTGLASQELLVRLDLEGIAASSGSACAAGAPDRGHVREALGIVPSTGVIRFSLGTITKEDEVTYLLDRLPRIVRTLRGEGNL